MRRFKRDGALYFGPYTSSASMKETVSNLRRIFPLRSCRDAVFRDYARRGRPCIEYEMRRCLGPCCGLVDESSYAELVEGTVLFLRGVITSYSIHYTKLYDFCFDVVCPVSVNEFSSSMFW